MGIIERGGRFGAVLRFLPPLVASEEELLQAAQIFGDSLAEAVQKLPASSSKLAEKSKKSELFAWTTNPRGVDVTVARRGGRRTGTTAPLFLLSGLASPG